MNHVDPRPKRRPSDGASASGSTQAPVAAAGARPDVPLPLRRHPLVPRFARVLDRLLRGHHPAGARAPAVLAVSGGADSVALLLAAAALAGHRRRPWPAPVVAHVHHHLRGADADADAAFVAELAARHGFAFRRRDVHPAEEPGSTAAAARRLRLAALADVATREQRGVVLTAHHAEDQLETVLLRLARGVDPASAGMPAIRPIAPDSPILLVRPFLDVPRADLRSLCDRAGTAWREDASNDDRTRPRTRLRAEVLPVLEEIASGAAARVAAAVHRTAVPSPPTGQNPPPPVALAFDRAALAALPPPARMTEVRAAMLVLAPAVADHLTRTVVAAVSDAIADDEVAPRRWDLAGGLRVHLDAHRLGLERGSGPSRGPIPGGSPLPTR